MAEIKQWPYPLNQAGYPYPAQFVRAEHYSATSGGNGVSEPGALKVTAQPAPDGTIQILPGGASVVSTYQPGQSYHVQAFQPLTVTVPQTGSASGGRHDLVVLRVLDPEFEPHPDHSGEMTEEAAQGLDFWWIEVIQGRSADTVLNFPHVKLAHILRPANTTIVAPEHIVDLRKLAKPQNHLHMRANNLYLSEEQSLHSTTSVFPTAATHHVEVPEWASRVQVSASWGSLRSGGATSGTASGVAFVRLVNSQGDGIRSQQNAWRYSGGESRERLNFLAADSFAVPESFRGDTVRVELHANKSGGPNIYADGDSNWSVQLYFEQEIS